MSTTPKTIAPRRVVDDLWRVKSGWVETRRALAESEGELTDTLEEQLERLDLDDREAVEQAVRAIRYHERMSGAKREEARAFADAARGHDATVERIKSRLAELLTATKRDRVDTLAGTVSRATGRMHVEVENVDALPESYIRTTRAPDKRLIAEALKDGHPVPGARLARGDDHVVIT